MATQTYSELLQANIIGIMGLESLPDEEKSALLDKMQDLVQKRVGLRVMDELSDEDALKMAEFENDPEGALTFIAQKMPDFETIVNDEIVKLKAEMAAVAEGVQ